MHPLPACHAPRREPPQHGSEPFAFTPLNHSRDGSAFRSGTDQWDGHTSFPAKRRRTEKCTDHAKINNPHVHQSYKRWGPKDTCSTSVDLLLRRRVVSFTDYQVERKSPKLTQAECVRRYGTTVVPIPVPLFQGESIDEYEQCFEKYLRGAKIDLARLKEEPNSERSVRMNFARSRKKQFQRHRVTSEKTTTKPDPSSTQQKECHHSSSDVVEDDGSLDCALSGVGFATEVDRVEASLECGCHSCMVASSRRLAARVLALDRMITTGALQSIMDSREQDVHTSPSSTVASVSPLGHSVSITGCRPRSAGALPLTQDDDLIIQQLQTQYDEINARVIASEQSLEHGTLPTDDGSQAHLQEVSQRHSENQELRRQMEEGVDHRSAVAAMLIVLLWRHTAHELEQRLYAADAGDIIHVQRQCHQKLAALANTLARLRAQAHQLTAQLDVVLNEPPPQTTVDAECDRHRLVRLQQLGAELTHVEEAQQKVAHDRRRELATLIHCDAHVRALIATLLQDT